MKTSTTNYRQLSRRFAQQEGIDPNLFERQINQESGFNVGARSPVGAQGIAQIMPATAAGWGVDPNDPVASLKAAAHHMAQYQHQFGGYRNALVAYNAGPGAVGHNLPSETRNYIATIMGGGGGVSPAAAPTPSLTRGGGQPSSPPDNRVARMMDLFAKMNQTVNTPLGLGESSARDSLDNSLQQNWSLLSQLARPQASNTRRSPGGSKSTTTMPTTVDSVGVGRDAKGGYHLADFEGTHVASWMVPALKYARTHGWQGHVTSGVRTRQEQQYLYDHPQGFPVARPGTSNHEIENGGAFDVDPHSAESLHEILKSYSGRKPIWAPSVGLNDKVHFSLTGH